MRYMALVLFVLFLAGCNSKPEAIPSHEEMVAEFRVKFQEMKNHPEFDQQQVAQLFEAMVEAMELEGLVEKRE
jgi:PBP1b-binding outer membrane lipoprotein LpoB